jgi:transcription elongation factor
MLVKNQRHVKIPQRLFNPQHVKNEARLEFSRLLGKKVYVWKDLMFRNGFLYHKFSISKLGHENVCPMLNEVRLF